ncbi:G-type lectin S-receptor-like serine/threonine-protein kinase CES101 [Pyrus ussuriensis x Pyrus communis]|uniref:non-specific serine/threonine protein kinase n=1 Tax=Pyrus ussuriensis x Pyrus communis TaxID=2448454 RepID=A0A5N5H005_9ROSA|nr:G-type lectin S-receptor-like serine/threonine-protein kinase CES101 [Pyrus ussuriensis x Pyrus communis]
MKIWRPFHVVFCTFACVFVCLSRASSDTLRHRQYLYSNQTLVSAGGVFELDFFSSPSAPNRYLGICNSPLMDSYGMVGSSGVLLTIRNDGNMVIIDRRNISYIVNYEALASGNNTTATLLDLGNLFLVSWSSTSVPAHGTYALGIDPVNNTQFNVWRNYVTFSNKNSSMPSRFVLSSDGLIYEFMMIGNEIKNVDYSRCADTMASSSTHCLVRRSSACSKRESFSNVKGMLPSYLFPSWPIRIDPYDCEIICRNNCSCVAYTYDSLPDDGTICQLYYGNNVPHSWAVPSSGVKCDAVPGHGKLLTFTFMVIPLVFFMLTLLLWIKCNSLGIYGFRNGTRDSMRLSLSQLSSDDNASCPNLTELGRQKDHELPLLSYSFIVASTNNFSLPNKLGQGGFGPVYNFKNEVQLISKLQHRNLVKLLGFCIHREEKILTDEYMPNKSLDSFIFDLLLNWGQRIHIIEGIAQGLLYLHKYSRLRIIHRDLKISHILLDAYMNPKISDFNLAGILSGNECRAKTNRVVGTYGYMSPKYLMHGLFSTKSDVFSFGVIVLEIVSGWKNAKFYDSMERLVPCIQVGLLCVQDSAEDRPTMSDVVSMLSNEGATLPTPKQPTYSNLTTEKKAEKGDKKLVFKKNI